MAEIKAVDPVKFFVAVLYRETSALERARLEITKRWGTIDSESDDFPFDMTDYYESEMGAPLNRRLLFLNTLYPPTLLVDMKLICNDIETLSAIDTKRIMNLDCGYLDHHKVVLASAKGAGHKLYLDKGIWGDFAARWKGGAFQPFEWSFPDFKNSRYAAFLAACRADYLKQLRQHT